jgi:hypothetical protein
MHKALSVLCLALTAGSAGAANINIGPNGCTLADAITAANLNAPVGNCAAGSGSDVIIAPDGWLVTLQSDLPNIASDMTIRSASPAGVFTILGNNQRRVLRITGSNTNVTLQRLVVGEGRTTTSDGAGIRIDNATVRIEDSRISGNDATSATGDGIFVNGGDLTLHRTTVRANGNQGVRAINSSVHVIESTFYFNSNIDFGFGLGVSGGSLLVERSLFDEFGGITGSQTVAQIENSTFTYLAGGGYVPSAFSFRDATTLTINHVTTTTPFTMVDSFLSASNSFLGTCELFSTPVLLDTGNSSRMGNCLDNFGIGPTLLPLADNGGPTLTMAIAEADSEAINGGDPGHCQALDQRGEARGATCDIGAYEATGFADVGVRGSLEPGAPYIGGQSVVYLAEIENEGPGVATNVRVNLATSQAFISSVNSPFCAAIPCIVSSIQPGQTLLIPIQLNFGNHLSGPYSIQLTAQATANSTHVDENPANNTASLAGPLSAGADMAVTMDLVTSGPYFTGQLLQYQATVRNFGPQTATGIQLQFAPTGLSGVSFSGCASVSGQVCNIANIGSGGGRLITIQGTVSAAQFNAVATVSAAQVDINAGNNVDDLGNGGGVTTSDIAVTASLIDVAPYYSYQYIRFQIVIAAGSNPASNIRLDYDFPGSEYIDIQGCASIPCVLPALAANSQLTLLAQFFAPIALPGLSESLELRVSAFPGQQDPNPGNNEAVVTAPLLPTADMAAQLSLLTPPPYYVGQELAYSLRVVNAGINDATSIAVGLSSQNLFLVSTFGTLCQAMNCAIARLNAFDEENITLVLRINGPGAFDLTATAFADEFDSMPANNTDSTGNGGVAVQPPNGDIIFANGFD